MNRILHHYVHSLIVWHFQGSLHSNSHVDSLLSFQYSKLIALSRHWNLIYFTLLCNWSFEMCSIRFDIQNQFIIINCSMKWPLWTDANFGFFPTFIVALIFVFQFSSWKWQSSAWAGSCVMIKHTFDRHLSLQFVLFVNWFDWLVFVDRIGKYRMVSHFKYPSSNAAHQISW